MLVDLKNGAKKHAAPLLLCAILALTATAWYARARFTAAAALPPDLLALVPGDASMIAFADMAVLRDDPLVQRLVAMAQSSAPAKEYADFVAGTGFEYQRDLDRVVIISRLAPAPSAAPSASQQPAAQTPAPQGRAQTFVLAEGRFDQQKIEQYALRHGSRQESRDRAIYSTPATTPGKTTTFTFLSPGRVALTDSGDLSAMLDGNSRVPLDAAMQQRVSRVSGSPVFAVAKPSAIGPANSAAEMATPLQSLRWLSLAARPEGERILLSAEGECENPQQASQLAAMLELLRGVLRGAMSDPKGRGGMPAETAESVTRLFEAAQISTEAERVRLLVSVDPAMLAPQTTAAPGQ
jgi:hypothetical protein